MAIAINIDPSVIDSYDSLLALIPRWLDRDDLGERIADFVALTEARLNRVIRSLSMEVRDTWVVSDGAYDLPNDFRMLRSLHISGSPNLPLLAMAPSGQTESFSGMEGTPRAYSISNRTLILSPPPDEAVTLSAIYYRRIPPLTDSAQTNWLISEHPDVYVWGTLQQAAIYIRDPEAIGTAGEMLDQAIEEVKAASRRDRWGAAPLVPNITRQVGSVRC